MATALEVEAIPLDRAAQLLAQPALASIRWAIYEFALRFLAPLLLDRMTEEQIKGLVLHQKVDYPNDESLETKARRKLYSDTYEKDMPVGLVGVPRDNLYAALRDAGEVVQYGTAKNDRVTMSTKGTQLFNMVTLLEPFFPIIGLDGKPAEWVVDLRKGNATQGTGAVGIVRPRFDEGGIVGHIGLNVDSQLSEDKMKELIMMAGVRQGLCSARPSKKMPFGQFALTHLMWVGGAEPRKTTARTNGAGAKPKRGKKASSAPIAEGENGVEKGDGEANSES